MTDPSFIWLVAGGALTALGASRSRVAVTAWLAPLFLLLFARAGEPLPGLGLI